MFLQFNLSPDMRKRYVLLMISMIFLAAVAGAQTDSTAFQQPAGSGLVSPQQLINDSISPGVTGADTVKKRSPAGTAALLSAILPGAGQVYNKKYWKVPIVYGVLAIPTYTFVDNLRWFKKTRLAYNLAFNKDTARYNEVDPRLLYMVKNGYTTSLQNYRDAFRRNVDYSALVFLLVWGLNIVDATVDAHLKDFNITDDLSLQFKPGYMPIGNTAGVGLVLHFGKNHTSRLPAGR